MTIVDFKPEYTVISTGDKTAFYTLRVVGTAIGINANGRYAFNHSYFIRNLSTDREKALETGTYYSEQLGYPFKPNADFDLNDIKRRRSEDLVAEREALERYERERTEAAVADYDRDVTAGVLLMGKYADRTIEEVAETDPDYLYWLAREAVEYSESETVFYNKFNASALIAKKWADANPRPISNWIGEVDEKITFTAKLTKIVDINSFYASTLFRFVTDQGNIVVMYSTAKKMYELNKGDVVTIQATVKSHDNSMYEDVDNSKVTLVKRPKIL